MKKIIQIAALISSVVLAPAYASPYNEDVIKNRRELCMYYGDIAGVLMKIRQKGLSMEQANLILEKFTAESGGRSDPEVQMILIAADGLLDRIYEYEIEDTEYNKRLAMDSFKISEVVSCYKASDLINEDGSIKKDFNEEA